MKITVVHVDLLDQDVDVLVNAWNRNVIPWWLLIPQGVAGAIKRRAGTKPFRELARNGVLALGQAVLTGPGRLPHRGIIHVAAINLLWRASDASIQDSVRNAVAIAREHGFRSLAFPLLGAGVGGFSVDAASSLMRAALEGCDYDGEVVIVRYEA